MFISEGWRWIFMYFFKLWNVSYGDPVVFLRSTTLSDQQIVNDIFPHFLSAWSRGAFWQCVRVCRWSPKEEVVWLQVLVDKEETDRISELRLVMLCVEVGNPTHIGLMCQWRNGLWSFKSTWSNGGACSISFGFQSSTRKGSDHFCSLVFPFLPETVDD